MADPQFARQLSDFYDGVQRTEERVSSGSVIWRNTLSIDSRRTYGTDQSIVHRCLQ